MAEISSAGFQWRLLAGAMGIPFISACVMLGTDTFEKCVAKVARDPCTGERVCLLPSSNPDMAIEEIVGKEVIGTHPDRTTIPFFLLDAVCEVPYAAHPALMPYLYYFDEAHIHEWRTLSKTEEGMQAYLDKYV